MNSKVVWQQGMAFEAELEGFSFSIDADEKFGGKNRGPKPKGLTLTSLAGCTAMDVIAILEKMRVAVDAFEVSASGELTEDHPKKFFQIELTYRFSGEDLPEKKLRRAVSLSEERYCGVRASLDDAIAMKNRIFVNGQELPATTPDAES